ncbi:DMT family transporter [Bacillus atrophaeus]|uniref:DMT family transporter n=1 Tax=Bacillus atrophaeus TaxID=1452 RepID=UPI000330DBCE|nr:multidrug efflux SMR transporter [Bacillus atrophaeus]AKL83181.1 YvaE [Bacillus atrophaeus UCMB-5137]MDS9998789.1 multidrug efflux SMR transporter [Bacillus atrophaeus]PRR89031.1 QacE family quaternary ammonium compound efflux SMR transporter [Bacillus atrophaeus]QUF65936.1 multidrug efflux SMR transporter [Bacillus atrophaeus]
MSYVYLLIAVLGELTGTSMLKASESFTKVGPVIGVFVSFFISFFCISLALKTIPLNVAYAIWAGLGAVGTTLISILIWKEKINFASGIGILLIVVGVVVLNAFGPGHGEAASTGNE